LEENKTSFRSSETFQKKYCVAQRKRHPTGALFVQRARQKNILENRCQNLGNFYAKFFGWKRKYLAGYFYFYFLDIN